MPVYDDEKEKLSKDPEAKAPTPDELAEAEAAAPTFYNPNDKQRLPGQNNGLSRLLAKKRYKLIAGSAILAIVGGIVGILLFFLPTQRLESYLQRINQRAFATASNALEARTNYLFERYMINHILNLDKCKAVRSIDCRATYTKGIAANLFNAWRDARAEEKIFDRLGFSIESRANPDSREGIHRFTLKDRRGNLITFAGEADWDKFVSGQFTGGNREFGRSLRAAIKDETRLLSVMERRSVRKYLTRKHGIRVWCFFACNTRDNIDLKISDAKTRFKYRFVERFITPFSGKYGFIMNCIISGDSCKPEDAKKRGLDSSRLTEKEAQEIAEHFKKNPNARLFSFTIEKILTKITNEQIAKKAIGAIPIVGQIYLGVVVVDMLDRADGFIANKGLSKFAADLNARQYVEYYAGMRTVNDEMKAGALSFEEVGAVMTDFEGAEESLVFQSYNGPDKSAYLFSNKAYAQSSQTDDEGPYVCAKGQPIDTEHGELVCPEKKVTRTFAIEDVRGNKIVSGLSEGLFAQYRCAFPGQSGDPNNPCIGPDLGPRDIVRPILKVIDATTEAILGPISSGLINLVKKTPGIGDLLSFIFEKTTDLFLAFFQKVFPLPVGVDSPGREKYDGLEAGADIASSEYSKGGFTDSGEPYGLGAPVISDADAAAIYSDQWAQLEYEHKNQGLLAKLRNTEYPNSLGNRLLATMPANLNQLRGRLASGFSSLFRFDFFSPLPVFAQQSSAEQQLAINAFGVTRFGYKLSDPLIGADPELYTPEYCQQLKSAWEVSKYENPSNGFEEYKTANPCLLEEAVVESAGSWYTDE